MNLGKIFLILSCCILMFSIININTGPIVTLTIGYSWPDLNCDLLSDEYDNDKKQYPDMDDDVKKYEYEYPINLCKLRKGMYAMEYSSLVVDAIIGFVLTFISFFHFFGIKNEYVPYSAIIGIISSIIGFIFTFIYIVYNGLVYTNDYYVIENVDLFLDIGIYKSDNDGSFAKLDNFGRYRCIDYESPENIYSFFAKYKDYHKRQYHYDKDLYFTYKNEPEIRGCTNEYYFYYCVEEGYIDETISYTDNNGISHQCRKLYFYPYETNLFKYISDKFLASLIFSLFICLCQICLIIIGIMLYRTPEF